jgi:hypothetical protein
VRGIWVIPAVVSACGFSPVKARDGGPGAIDTATVFMDAQPDTPADENCFGSLTYDTVCFKKSDPQPTGVRNVNMMVPLDSDDDANCDQFAMGVPGTCVVSFDSMTITGIGKLRLTGMRPVILLASGTNGINLNSMALLDLGSNTADQGAGGLASCSGTTAATEHGGGFGGSFVVTGGGGGKDEEGNGAGVPATPLGMPTTLHGGCPGGVGATDVAAVASAAGKAGGAVVLIASVIIVDGLIAAYGGGGHGNQTYAGGGGAGAGGMVVLDSALIKGNGEVDVKGGGGGGGAGGNSSGNGHDGYEPPLRLEEGSGGTDISSGGDGGHGGPRGDMDPTGEDGMLGSGGGPNGGPGGGGGGGAEGVVVTTSTPTTTITGVN